MNRSRVWERALSAAATGAWAVLQAGNRLVPGTARRARWAPSAAGTGAASSPELDIPRSTTRSAVRSPARFLPASSSGTAAS
jgi:hypothetical protein